MRKINEIFHSLQGEGRHAGCPSVFVRFSGCNKRCKFCDTDHESGTSMTDDEIVRAVNNLYKGDWIVLTGGEPALWIDSDFVRLLKRATGKRVAIETNGSLPVPSEIDWVTVSPKSGFEGAGEYELKVSHADELKVVDLGQPLEGYFELPCVGSDTLMYLQPCHVDDEEESIANRLRTVGRVMSDPRWTLSLQIHRFLDIP
ncbi:MAG: 7-carboxy-7-deazaguanine synthase QueE [Muribaculaceae bacterium]|nr:7-carboxy-7-deazaguanine synthase QueE [Muribaculaceae bacterium]